MTEIISNSTPKEKEAIIVTTSSKSVKLLNWAIAKQLEISLCILILILGGNVLNPMNKYLSTHYTPDSSYHLSSKFSRCLFLSFQKPGTELYYKGRDDAYLIGFWIVVFWFLREASMRWMWEPLARKWNITDRRAKVRFAEQGWNLLYYSVFWSLGLYIIQNSPYRNLNTAQFYIGYPHDALPPLTKWYYLVQTAFWLQQIIVLNLEARRKDYHQMFAHHIITTALMCLSYVLNWTRIGSAILCSMDFADILLSLAKIFVYTKKQSYADATFAAFILSWIATRHVIYGILVWSTFFELRSLIPYDWRPRDGYFNSYWSLRTFWALLIALQIILCIWFWMICRVAYKALLGHTIDDSRSDSGSDDEFEEGEEDDNEKVSIPSKVEGRTSHESNGNGNGNGKSVQDTKKDR